MATDFFASIWPTVMQASSMTGVDPRIIAAQAALESNFGRSAPGNNLFGIKSHGQAGGNNLMTTEVVNGKPVRVNASFRAYGSPAESVMGYADFINSNPRYGPMRSAQGFEAQLRELQKSGYATDPNYAAKVRNIASGIPGSFPDAPMQGFTGPVSERPLASFNDMGGGFGQLFSGLPFGDPNAPPDPMRFGDVQGPYTPVQEYDEMGGTMMAGTPGTGGAWGGGSGGIPRSVSDYATDDKDDGFFSRMGRALTKMEQSQRPIGGGFRGGASNGNALLEVLNSPTIKDLLMKKRLG